MKGSELGKDPAVSFFFNDWMGGTMTFTRHQKGCYMDLLTAQFNNGHLTKEEIKNVLGNDFANWGVLSKKFKEDSDGKFYNERLELEIVKRKKYNKSRRDNLNPHEGDSPHMGIGNGIGIEIEKRKGVFVIDVNKFTDYPEQLRIAFIAYWTEHKPTGRKMRFELEKVFDISRRLSTWQKNDEVWNKNNTSGTKGFTDGMPDCYDAVYMAKLKTGPEIQRYQQHLHSKGLRPLKNRFNDIIDWVPAEKLKVAS